jgi:RNA polymerase sigma-70 factor, ECF subfamily
MRRSKVSASDDVATLVAAAKSGDRDAFDALVSQTYLETYSLAYRLTGDEEDARDVVQESYLRAYRGLRRFRGDAQFSTWLYRITANCASTQLGRRSRHRHDELDDELPDDRLGAPGSPEAAVDAGVLRDRLQVALSELPPRLRAVVVLRDVYDLPHDAIAEELGISVSAAKVRLHRARRRLRDDLFSPRDETIDERDARAV